MNSDRQLFFILALTTAIVHAMEMPMEESFAEEITTSMGVSPETTTSMGLTQEQLPPPSPQPTTTTTTTTTGSDVKSEQFGWPDTIELAENKPAPAAGGPGVLLIYKESEEKLANITTVINTLNKMRQSIYQKFFDLDAMLDAFFQKTSADIGSLEETFSKKEMP